MGSKAFSPGFALLAKAFSPGFALLAKAFSPGFALLAKAFSPGFALLAKASRWLGSLILFVILCSTSNTRAQSAIGLDFALFLDDISLEDSERIGPLHEIQREDRSNVNITEGAIYYLHHLGSPEDRLAGFRIGGEFRYLGEYATELDKKERDKQVLGTLMELGFRGDWTVEIAEHLGLVVGLRFDLAILVPGGDFANEIERLKDEGVPTSDGPRVGLALIPSVGARYAVHDRINLRFDLGLGWSYLDLFGIDAGVQTIQYVRDASLSSRRFEMGLGVEIVL